jgi:hypothetical protein
VLAVFCWLHRDQLVAALDREIDAEADDKAALSHEARERQAAEVQGDPLDIERQEATLMFLGWADGLPIQPRPELAPVAVLNVRLVTAPTINGRGSSPQHVISIVGAGRQ